MQTFEEVKEYSDAYTQHDLSGFTSRSTQTPPPPQPQPKPRTVSMSIQTDTESSSSSAVATERDVQEDDPMASSSATLLPPTPRQQNDLLLHPHDLPPAYNQDDEDDDEREWRLAAETLKKWHRGAKIPFDSKTGGAFPQAISEDAVMEWKMLKEELGIDCAVIDKIIAASQRTGLPRSAFTGGRLPHSHSHTHTHSEETSDEEGSPKSRFYNIYNTYVYGTSRDGTVPNFPTQFLLGIGATALLFLAMGPYMVPHYAVPGGPTYYDRTAWHSFNAMQAAGEGFSPDGTAAVWSVLGRIGGRAARIAGGWPT
jgi:hypothetical protein